MMRTRIEGGRVIDPANNIDAELDVYLADGQIVAVGDAPESFSVDQVITAENKLVCPGLIDLSARLGEPGSEHQATIATETRAAVSSGITTVVCPPDTDPVIDSAAVAEMIRRHSAAAGLSRVLPLGALTSALEGKQLSEMMTLLSAGVVSLSNANQPIESSLVMQRAMEYAATQNITLFITPVDAALSEGCMHEGALSTRLGLPGIPESAETAALARDLVLVEQTGVSAHFCRLTCAKSVDMIARAQQDGLAVTADVSAHHLFLTDIDIREYDSHCHVLPPLRSERDRDALRQGIRDGIITAICSDHTPHEEDAKAAPFASTLPGMSALETMMPLSLRLANDGVADLSTIISCLSAGPANILNLPYGSLSVGATADVCIIDPQFSWMVDTDTLLSAAHNSAFLGWEMFGRATHTFIKGHLVYSMEH